MPSSPLRLLLITADTLRLRCDERDELEDGWLRPRAKGGKASYAGRQVGHLGVRAQISDTYKGKPIQQGILNSYAWRHLQLSRGRADACGHRQHQADHLARLRWRARWLSKISPADVCSSSVDAAAGQLALAHADTSAILTGTDTHTPATLHANHPTHANMRAGAGCGQLG